MSINQSNRHVLSTASVSIALLQTGVSWADEVEEMLATPPAEISDTVTISKVRNSLASLPSPPDLQLQATVENIIGRIETLETTLAVRTESLRCLEDRVVELELQVRDIERCWRNANRFFSVTVIVVSDDRFKQFAKQ